MNKIAPISALMELNTFPALNAGINQQKCSTSIGRCLKGNAPGTLVGQENLGTGARSCLTVCDLALSPF